MIIRYIVTQLKTIQSEMMNLKISFSLGFLQSRIGLRDAGNDVALLVNPAKCAHIHLFDDGGDSSTISGSCVMTWTAR